MNYHKSVSISEDELKYSIARATTQDKEVLQVFEDNSDKLMTSWGVRRKLYSKGIDMDIGSVRRSINTLKGQDKVVKTNITKVGDKGSSCCCWKYLPEQLHMFN